MKSFGIGYQGSKNRIAKDIVDFLPSADVFVDLFAGGCAVTHAAAVSGKYKIIIANDIDNAPQLFLRALKGEFKNVKDWVSKDDFDKRKFEDAYIRYIWSFGNNGLNYLYSKASEEQKKQGHLAVADDFSKYRAKDNRIISIERIKRLREIAKSDIKSEIFISQLDYKQVEIPQNSIVYCDIPYDNTRGYTYLQNILKMKHFFSHNEFYDYCLELKRKNIPCYVSEYDMPNNFESVWSKKKFVTFNKDNIRKHKIEQIFVPKISVF